MRAALLLCAGALVHAVAASITGPSHRSLRLRQDDGLDDGDDDGDDDADNYLDAMCFPNESGDVEDDSSASTPCEIFELISNECEPNGTDPIDYLAQQECICGSGSGYFDMLNGCNNCIKVHGGIENSDYFDPSIISSVSSAFCTGTPTTDFDDFIFTALPTVAPTGSGTDLFPSMTAVSNYFTGALETNAGQITGSATLATYNSGSTGGDWSTGDGSDSTDGSSPTVTTGLASGQTGVSTTSSGTASKSSASKSSSSKVSSTTSSTSSAAAKATGNAAAELKAMGGMLSVVAAGVGIIYAL